MRRRGQVKKMSTIKVGENESVESALRRFKRKAYRVWNLALFVEKFFDPEIKLVLFFALDTLWYNLLMDEILDTLNEEQKKPVCDTEGAGYGF